MNWNDSDNWAYKPDVFENLNPSKEDDQRDHVVVLHLPESQELKVSIDGWIFEKCFK